MYPFTLVQETQIRFLCLANRWVEYRSVSKARYISWHVHFQSLIKNDIQYFCSYIKVRRKLSLQSTGTEKRFDSDSQPTYRPEPYQPHVRRYLIKELSSILTVYVFYTLQRVKRVAVRMYIVRMFTEVYKFWRVCFVVVGRDIPARIATRYQLGIPGIKSLWKTRFSTPVQTGPGTHPVPCKMGTGSLSRG